MSMFLTPRNPFSINDRLIALIRAFQRTDHASGVDIRDPNAILNAHIGLYSSWMKNEMAKVPDNNLISLTNKIGNLIKIPWHVSDDYSNNELAQILNNEFLPWTVGRNFSKLKLADKIRNFPFLKRIIELSQKYSEEIKSNSASPTIETRFNVDLSVAPIIAKINESILFIV